MFSFILDWMFENLPVLVNVDCENSKTIKHMILSPITGKVIAQMTSGSVYSFHVRRLDMLRINQYESVGKWMNDCVIV